jgi:CubicO group peptidase (beta-lactamase class C family)
MNAILCALAFLCLFLPIAHAGEIAEASPGELGLSAEKLRQVTTVVQGMMDKQQTAGAVVLVARHGKIARLDAIGKMSAATGEALRPDAIFRIYSMTKPVTSVAALMLYDEGKLKLDEPVSRYLPEFSGLRVYAGEGKEPVPATLEMTVRDLMRHTSGLTYGFLDDSPVDRLYRTNRIGSSSDTLADFTRKLGKLPLEYQPGTRFNYSYSTDVLARIIEVVSGKPFDEFLVERIFRPLDMHDTGFFVPDDKLKRFTASHRRGAEMLQVTDAPATSPFRKQRKFLSGGGGLVSTARDYLRFAQMLLNGGEFQGTRLLRAETVREMTTNQLPPAAPPMTLGKIPLAGLGFGLGVSVRLDTKTGKPDPAAGEYGWSGAASTYFWIAPRSDLIVVVLQQLEPFNFDLQLALKPVIYAAIEK